MKVKLIGVQNLDFTTDSGDRIKGLNLFVSYEDVNMTAGRKTSKLFLREDIAFPANVKIGEELEILFSMKGKPETVSKIG